MRLLPLLGGVLVMAATGQAMAQRPAPATAPVAATMPMQAARPAQPACFTPQQPGAARIRMKLLAEHTDTDPAKIWSGWDLWNPNSPQRTTIWAGSVPLCGGGEIIVSQIMNRQCSSNVECPVRVVQRQPNNERVLLSYEQVCTLHGTYQLQGDLKALRACNVGIPLRAD